MHRRDIQRRVADFVDRNQLEIPVEYRTLDLVSEVGELAKEVLEASRYGDEGFEPSPAWEEEMGDALFSLVCLANSTGVDLERALKGALRKYRSRMDTDGNPSSTSPVPPTDEDDDLP